MYHILLVQTAWNNYVFSPTQGYWGQNALITAQTPLPDTMADFWSMVFQKKASTIVMLSDCREGEEVPKAPVTSSHLNTLSWASGTCVVKNSCFLCLWQDSDSVYWDKEKKRFGDIEVEVESTDDSPAFITRTMVIRHGQVTPPHPPAFCLACSPVLPLVESKLWAVLSQCRFHRQRTESRTVKHFQFLKWDDKDLPEKPQDFTDMVKDIKRHCGGNKQKSIPVVVHCK